LLIRRVWPWCWSIARRRATWRRRGRRTVARVLGVDDEWRFVGKVNMTRCTTTRRAISELHFIRPKRQLLSQFGLAPIFIIESHSHGLADRKLLVFLHRTVVVQCLFFFRSCQRRISCLGCRSRQQALCCREGCAGAPPYE